MEALRWQNTRKGGKYRKSARPQEERILLEDVAPPLVSSRTWQAVQERISSSQLSAYRNNRKPDDTLLRGGHVLCGYCNRPKHVFRTSGSIYYRCTQTNRDRHGFPAHRILAKTLDQAVWSKVETVLTRPDVLASEVAKLRSDDRVSMDMQAIERRLVEVDRRRATLARRIATIDDDDIVAPLLVELKQLGEQATRLQSDRAELVAEHESWRAVEQRLDELQYWCEVQAKNLAGLEYEQKRLALFALNVESRVWRSDHDPRYEIKMRIDLVGNSESDSAVANTTSSSSGWIVSVAHKRR